MKNNIISICLLVGIAFLFAMCDGGGGIGVDDPPSRGKIIAENMLNDSDSSEFTIQVYLQGNPTQTKIKIKEKKCFKPSWFKKSNSGDGHGDWIYFTQNGSSGKIDVIGMCKVGHTIE